MTNSGTYFDCSKMTKGLVQLDIKMKVMLLMFAQTEATILESYMKVNRVWTDRTSMAKNSLTGRAGYKGESGVRITLAHGVDYGLWLELANEKNYAIVEPTVRLRGPEVIKDMKGLLDKINIGIGL